VSGSTRCRNTGLSECFPWFPEVPVENSVILQSPNIRRFKRLKTSFNKVCSFILKCPTSGVIRFNHLYCVWNTRLSDSIVILSYDFLKISIKKLYYRFHVLQVIHTTHIYVCVCACACACARVRVCVRACFMFL
jgi:hypothetical protein